LVNRLVPKIDNVRTRSFNRLKEKWMQRKLIPVLGLLLAGSVAAAKPLCLPVMGTLTLEPDPMCAIADLYQGPTYLGTCFKVTVSGMGEPVSGSAGMTMETLVSPFGGATQTPVLLNEANVDPGSDPGMERQIFTARSVLNLPGGKIYTRDVGVLNGDYATEQLVVTRGEGVYAGASGLISVYGRELSQGARFKGKICAPW
jgi:hypothetical protein